MLLRLYWSESESAADVKYCCSEFHLCLFYQAYLDLCDQLVVQEILPSSSSETCNSKSIQD